MIDHVGLEVSHLGRSAAFYDAVFFALGVRRVHEGASAIAYGVKEPFFWIVQRGEPAPGFGHVAVRASGRAAVDAAHAAGVRAGGASESGPADRPEYGPRYYAAYLTDPDGLRVEVVTGTTD
jgi:catechol 2,3-dioxygenase-like lactoylglutathione lyase family enzyme